MSEIQCRRTSRGDEASAAFFSTIRDPAALSREVVEASPDCFKILDLAGRIEFMNRNGQCLMEIGDFAAIAGRAWVSLWPVDQQRKVEVAIAAARAGDTARFTAFCPTAAGVPKWWDVVVYCVHDAAGELSKIVSVSRDVTEAVRAQHELEAMLCELRGLLEINGRLKQSAA